MTLTRSIAFVAMVMLTMVSMWTTYVSLHDSILPEPTISIPIPGIELSATGTAAVETQKAHFVKREAGGVVWECSIVALAMSLAIGLMLLALKTGIVSGEKRLNPLGIVGLTIVAFISISFNMDVLYRMVERDFFVQYSADKMRSNYDVFFAEAKRELQEQQGDIRKQVAKQEGELEAEIRGLRHDPEGYGPRAKAEEYELTLLQKEAEVTLESSVDAEAVLAKADALLTTRHVSSLEEVNALQNDLRIIAKDLAGYTHVPMPQPVKLENPFFAVFTNLFDLEKVGLKELFILLIAFFLDVGDIIGYSLVPNRHPKKGSGGGGLTLLPSRDDDGPRSIEPDLWLPPALRDDTKVSNEAAPTDEAPPQGHQLRRRRGIRMR